MKLFNPRHSDSRHLQRGGFFLGLIVGLLVGLTLALGVALYIAKVPMPFVNKVPQHSAEQDAAETEKNKNWDPNSALYGKNPVRPGVPVIPASGAAAMASAPAVALPDASAPQKDDRDPAAILADKPAGDGAGYYVQAGAFARMEDAEQQRAKLAMMGLAAKITEREQSGRLIYRVRLGPFDKKDEAAQTKEKLDVAGVESALVAVQK